MASVKTKALQLNIEGLFRLLGGTAADRNRFFEIFKGITKPVEITLLNSQFGSLAAAIKQVQVDTKALKGAAQQIGKGKQG
jgi:hypothetical protein